MPDAPKLILVIVLIGNAVRPDRLAHKNADLRCFADVKAQGVKQDPDGSFAGFQLLGCGFVHCIPPALIRQLAQLYYTRADLSRSYASLIRAVRRVA
jgi:hypothetical protein